MKERPIEVLISKKFIEDLNRLHEESDLPYSFLIRFALEELVIKWRHDVDEEEFDIWRRRN